MKNFIYWLIVVFFIVAFQASVAHFMVIDGVKPDVVMVFVLLSGVMYGRAQGLVVGFFCGLFIDLLNSVLFGFYSFVFMAVGMLAGVMQKNVFEDNIVLPLLTVAAASCVTGLLLEACMFLAGYSWPYWPDIIMRTGYAALYNTAVTVPIIFLFNKIRKSAAAE